MLFLCAVLVFTASMAISGAAFTASISPQSAGVDYNPNGVAAFTLSTAGSSTNKIEYSYTINGTPYSRTGKCTDYITPFYTVGQQYALKIPDGGSIGPGTSADICNSGVIYLTSFYSPYTIVFSATADNTSLLTETATAFLNIYPTLTFKSLSVLAVSYSDVLRFNVSWVNASGYNSGVPPFKVAITYGTSSSSCSSDNTVIASANDITGLSTDTYALTANAPSPSGTYYYCASVTDSNYPNGITVSSISPVVANTVTAPTLSIISVPTKVDQGQQINVEFEVYNGIGPFSIAAYSNSIEVSSNVIVNTPNTNGSVSFGIADSPGNYIYTLAGVDKETNDGSNGITYDFSTNSPSIKVNPVLSAPTILLSSKSIEQGLPLNAELSWGEGTEPYTANVYVYNSTSNALVTGLTGLSVNSISSNTANISIQSNDIAPGTYYLKATVADSSGSGPEINSSISGNFVITPGPKIAETFIPKSTIYPNSTTVKIEAVNGTSPYTAVISIVNLSKVVEESNSIIITAKNSTVNYSTGTLYPGTYFANVILTDSAKVTVQESEKFIVSLHPSLTLEAPPNFIYNDSNATVTASVYPLGLTGNLIMSVNGGTGVDVAVLTASSNTITYNAPSAAGSYSFTLDTDANAIYGAENTTANYIISQYTTKPIISVPHNLEYNVSNATITASISPSNAIGNLYMSVDGGNYIKVDSTTPSSNAISFNAPATAGNYSFEFYNTANVLYAEGFSIGNYSIYKAIPSMSFLKSCSSYTVDGLSCNTTASIATYNSQVTARLYVNGTLVGSTSNTITYTGSNEINTYYIVFNTTGNENYSAYSISYAYDIHNHSSGSSSSTSTTTTVTTTALYSTIPSTSTVTTTIPQKTLNISPSDNSYSGSFGVSGKTPYNINFKNEDVFVKFASNFNRTVKANFTISNYTKALPYFPGHTLYKAINLNFSSNTTITANITMRYNCSSKYAISPYILENGTLVKIANYTVYPLSCTINFEVSSDPIIALYLNTTVPTTTISTTAPTTTISVTPKPSSNAEEIIALVIVVIVAIALFFAYTFTRKEKSR